MPGCGRPVTFFPDGHALAVADRFGKLGIWEVPLPLEGSAEHLQRCFEVLTGMALDARGTIHELSAEARQQRRLEETDGRDNP